MPAPLFSPINLGPFSLNNRVVVAPMCQYSADDGSASVWHIQHLMQMGMSGAGLIVLEATGVERRGRITHGCLGLYSDANEAALAHVLIAARGVAPAGTRFGVQIAHAGRKASTQRPWEGGKPLGRDEDPWTTCAPSAIPFAPDWHTPEALDEAGMTRVRAAFVQAAKRAVRLGLDVIELHCAHGYLIDTFLSPHVNKRTDNYGGSLENRMRFPLEIARAVKEVVPAHVVLGARIMGTDWTDNGWSPDDAAAFAKALKGLGAGYVCVSSGGTLPGVKIPSGPGYQLPLASHVKKHAGLPTRAVGHIVTPEQADEIVAKGEADMIALARAMLDNPRWPWHAAQKLGAEIPYPPQYARSAPNVWKGAVWAREGGLYEG